MFVAFAIDLHATRLFFAHVLASRAPMARPVASSSSVPPVSARYVCTHKLFFAYSSNAAMCDPIIFKSEIG